MNKKRGLSLDDKRNILMQLFKKEQSFFHYKDIEKFCGKNKISFMIVKDLLAGIVADNLVETEKIGSSSFYWSLPTRVLTAKQKTLEREIEKTSQLNNELDLIEKKIIENKKLRVDNERSNKLNELQELIEKKNEYDKIIKNFEKEDPERYEKLINDNKVILELYDFWMDNIYTLQQWLRTKSDSKIEDMFPDLKELHLFDED